MSNNEWDALFQFYNNLNISSTVFLKDFNAHYVKWGCERSDYTDQNLLHSALSHSLIFLNNGSPTFFSRPSYYQSAIDLTFVSSSLLCISSWEVLTDSMNSDHFPILISINLCIKKCPFFSHKINLRNKKKSNF